jgi:hypothetical protein
VTRSALAISEIVVAASVPKVSGALGRSAFSNCLAASARKASQAFDQRRGFRIFDQAPNVVEHLDAARSGVRDQLQLCLGQVDAREWKAAVLELTRQLQRLFDALLRAVVVGLFAAIAVESSIRSPS